MNSHKMKNQNGTINLHSRRTSKDLKKKPNERRKRRRRRRRRRRRWRRKLPNPRSKWYTLLTQNGQPLSCEHPSPFIAQGDWCHIKFIFLPFLFLYTFSHVHVQVVAHPRFIRCTRFSHRCRKSSRHRGFPQLGFPRKTVCIVYLCLFAVFCSRALCLSV